MAHFAELDENNVVLRVCVVDNAHVPSDKHADGETWCKNFWGGNWKQTSYNHKFRKQYAGIGYTYDETKDKFIGPQPHASHTLNSDDDWVAPIAYPSDGKAYIWNETAYQADNTKGWDLDE
tara:strand:- start:123 stop:485 length:363 start_codon:yes stop_codon:yes gene_type:complete